MSRWNVWFNLIVPSYIYSPFIHSELSPYFPHTPSSSYTLNEASCHLSELLLFRRNRKFICYPNSSHSSWTSTCPGGFCQHAHREILGSHRWIPCVFGNGWGGPWTRLHLAINFLFGMTSWRFCTYPTRHSFFDLGRRHLLCGPEEGSRQWESHSYSVQYPPGS